MIVRMTLQGVEVALHGTGLTQHLATGSYIGAQTRDT